MPGLDPKLFLHIFPIKPRVKPVKKKMRNIHPQVSLLIKAKLKKLLDVGFIKPIDYVE